MSLLLSKKHLRVEVPQTSDGVTLLYDENKRPVTKTVILPFSAKREIESYMAKQPNHLQGKITPVEGDVIENSVKQEASEFTPEQIEKLKGMTNIKGGRPKKEVTEEN